MILLTRRQRCFLLSKAKQRLQFLRVLRNNNLSERPPVAFNRPSIESILSCCITVWYTCCSAPDKKGSTNTAQIITGSLLPLPTPATSPEPQPFWRTAHTLATTCLTCRPLADTTGRYQHRPLDLWTVFTGVHTTPIGNLALRHITTHSIFRFVYLQRMSRLCLRTLCLRQHLTLKFRLVYINA